jgi:ankyrin repeat protein
MYTFSDNIPYVEMYFSAFDMPAISTVKDIELRNSSGDTPLLALTQELLRQVSLITDESNIYFLIDEYIANVDELIYKKANINVQDRHFRTPLILLAKSSYTLKAIRFLCEAGASTFYISGGGWDAIDEALYYGNMATVRYLREARKAQCLKHSAYTLPKETEKPKWLTFWKFI